MEMTGRRSRRGSAAIGLLQLSCAIALLILYHLSYSEAQIKYIKSDPGKVKIAVYYESLCPDSKQFVTNTLARSFDPNIMTVRFIPFGKAQISPDGEEYECQHGDLECARNRIQACALEWLNTDTFRVSYVYCALNNITMDGQQQCVEAHGVSWSDTLMCTSNPSGKQLMVLHGQDTGTNAGGPTFIPTIVINEKYSEENQNKALYGLSTFRQLIVNQIES